MFLDTHGTKGAQSGSHELMNNHINGMIERDWKLGTGPCEWMKPL